MYCYYSIQLQQAKTSSQDEKFEKVLLSAVKKLDSISKNVNRGFRDKTRSPEDRVTPAIEFMSEFIHPQRKRDLKSVALSDIMDGSLKHLNIRHIARLEHQLSILYGNLMQLNIHFDTHVIPNLAPLFSVRHS